MSEDIKIEIGKRIREERERQGLLYVSKFVIPKKN